MLSAYRLKELTLFDFSYSLSSLKSLVFIIPYFFFWYLIFDNISNQAVEWLQSGQGLMSASWLLGDQNLALQMFVDRSASLSIYLLIAVSVTPLFVMLAANNQYSSDASRGAFRFILTRATRAELFISRFLSVLLLIVICTFLTSLWASLQAWFNDEDSLQTIALFGLETFIIVVFYSLPFIAFMSMISAFARSAFGSLFLGMVVYVVLIVISLWLKNDISYATYLIPSGLKKIIFNISLENVLISLAALSCYAAIYFSLGWNIFKRRDI